MSDLRVDFSPEAQGALFDLYDWIAEKASPAIALAYAERIEAFCFGLGAVPMRGHRRDDVRPGLRIIGFEGRVTIAFAVESQRVVVLGLFYGGREWERLIGS